MGLAENLSAWLEGAPWREGAVSASLLLAALASGLLIHSILFAVLRKLSRRTSAAWDDLFLHHLAGPSRLLFPLLLAKLPLAALAVPGPVARFLGHLFSLLFLAAVSFLLVRLIRILREFLLSRYDLAAADNLSARKAHTQIRVLEKALLSIVAVATAAFMLMTFPGIRQVGISILASAGIAGVILGLAAQKSIGTLLAGLQIAVTQPIRMDDVVIVEGEWGRIEEITLTYVVVRIWDLRRLVVPITYFIDKPFQNWTRTSSEILGTVFLYADYRIPVDRIRQELERLVRTTPLWDGKVCGVQVTECREQVLEIRLLVSAASAGEAWDLRCFLREAMVSFLRDEFPGSLPRSRVELEPSGAPAQEARAAFPPRKSASGQG